MSDSANTCKAAGTTYFPDGIIMKIVANPNVFKFSADYISSGAKISHKNGFFALTKGQTYCASTNLDTATNDK